MFDAMQAYAQHILGVSEEWVAFRRECLDERGDFIKIDLGVGRVIQRGARKGRRTWKGTPTKELFFKRSDFNAWLDEWCAARGACRKCCGEGKRFKRWTAEAGSEYVPCSRCHGTGKVFEETEGSEST